MFLLLTLNLIWFTIEGQKSWYNCHKHENACQSVDCTAEDAATRSKIMCKEFPFYVGSLNLFDYQSQWSLVTQTVSECNNEDNSTTPYCNSWTQFDSDQTTECKCTRFESPDNAYNSYCVSWQCHNVEDKIVSSKCQCININVNNSDISYCASWICNNTDNSAVANNYSIVEYQCISDEPKPLQNAYHAEYMHFQNNTNHSWCWNWIGNTLNAEPSSWSVINCECERPKLEMYVIDESNTQHLSNLYCDAWICYKKSMSYYHISELQFYLSWTIASITGVLLSILRYFAFKYGFEKFKVTNAKHIIALKCFCNILLIMSLFTLLFWSFMYGSTLSALITLFSWNVFVSFMIIGVAVKRYLKKSENERLQEAQYEFKNFKSMFFPRLPTHQNSWFRYSHTESLSDDELDI